MNLPLATCTNCGHKVFPDEPHNRDSFIDASGNNDCTYSHKKCPRHIIKLIKVNLKYKCKDCNAMIDRDLNYEAIDDG